MGHFTGCSNALVGAYEDGHVNNPIWIAPVLGGAPRRLAEGGEATFSPDGQTLIYTTVDGDILADTLTTPDEARAGVWPFGALLLLESPLGDTSGRIDRCQESILA